MFAGITTLSSQDQGDLLLGMNSREGEQVDFTTQIKISEDPTINVWLTKVETQMRYSLSKNLENTMQDLIQLSDNN